MGDDYSYVNVLVNRQCNWSESAMHFCLPQYVPYFLLDKEEASIECTLTESLEENIRSQFCIFSYSYAL